MSYIHYFFFLLGAGLLPGLLSSPAVAEPVGLCQGYEECLEKLSKFTSERFADPTVGPERFDLRRRPAKSGTGWDIFLLLDADEAVQIGGETVTPALVLRCLNDTTNIYVAFDAPVATQDLNIFIRLDNNPWQTERFTASKNSEGLFPSTSPISMIRTLENHSLLRLWLKPTNSDPVALTFTLGGMHQALEPLKEACHWQSKNRN